ncbi:Zn-ribbon domain-containing OB-fold protein [Rhizorhapis sp. SPR117]|uniref:Zn-ribbon domain-containing OB-fold protein n=1 Tax=Rhizorhapis sp. SPR117 TaxID=2912611 RepID=UPI001F1C74D1|nr:Zn-ribbon domain-containing OB-fold protein [Rhizorhapis sp. SPR117]
MPYGPAHALPGDQLTITTNPDTAPFWEAAKEHRLTACQCGECGHFRMPPSPFCPNCQSTKKNWPDLPGTGTVFSYAICSKNPATGEDFIYVPVVVQLDGTDDARLISNIFGIDADDVRIGMKVQVEWNPINDGWVLPVFRPA